MTKLNQCTDLNNISKGVATPKLSILGGVVIFWGISLKSIAATAISVLQRFGLSFNRSRTKSIQEWYGSFLIKISIEDNIPIVSILQGQLLQWTLLG